MSKSKSLSFNAARGPCRVCGADGLPCARCRLDYYCGKQHQTEDWQRHKRGCGVLQVRQDTRLGRYVVATKDVPAGVVLLRELPIVVVPTSEPASKEVNVWCVGCLRNLLRVDMAGMRGLCSGCGFPVCSKQCSAKDAHRAECAAFQRAKYKLNLDELSTPESSCRLWTALGALRTHLASQELPQILELQGDYAELTPDSEGPFWGGVRKSVTEYRAMWREAARWLRGVARLKWVPEEQLVRGCGIINVNAIAGSDAETGSAHLLCGMSLLEHNCDPSAASLCVPGGEHVVVASRSLRRGDHVSLDYTGSPLDDTFGRRNFLRGWGFFCRCERCLDPTERGLYAGSLCCPTCSAAGRRCMMTTRDTWSDGWRCEECGRLLMASLYEKTIVKNASDALDATPHRVVDLEGYINDQLWPRGLLHPTHCLVLKAKKLATSHVARTVAANTMSEDELARLAAMLRELLAALDMTKSGPSMNRLIHLERLHVVEEARAWAAVKSSSLEPSRVMAQVAKVEKVLEEMRPMVLNFHGKDGLEEARVRYETLHRLASAKCN